MTLTPSEIEVIEVVLGAVLAAALTLGLSRRDGPRSTPSHAPRRPALILAVAILVTFAAYATIALRKLGAYNMGAEDLGRVDQAIWSVLQGRPLVFSASEIGRPMSRLAGHVELLYGALAPLFWIWDSAGALLVAQALLAALGAVPAYRIGRREGGASLGLAAALVYLAHPAFGSSVLADVHGDTLAMPLLLFALDHGLAGRRIPACIFALLALLAKEYVAALLVTTGTFFILARRDRRLGATWVALGLLWVTVVVPALHRRYRPGDFPQLTPIYFGALGSTPAEVVRTSLLHPERLLGHALSPRNLGVVALLLAPYACTALAAPVPLLLVLPVFVPLAVSGQLDLRNHHNATLLPFLLLAAVSGSRRIAGVHAPRVLLAASAVVHLLLGPSPVSIRSWTPGRWDYLPNPHLAGRTAHDAVLDRILSELPDDAALSVSAHLAAHVSHRATCFVFPAPPDRGVIDGAVVDLIGIHPPHYRSRREDIAGLRRYLADPAFALTRAEDGVFVLQRRSRLAATASRPPRPPSDPPPPPPPAAAAGRYGIGPLALEITPQGRATWTATRDLSEPILVLEATSRRVRLAPSTPATPVPWPVGQRIVDDGEPFLSGERWMVLRLPEGFPVVDPGDPPQPWMPDPRLGERVLP